MGNKSKFYIYLIDIVAGFFSSIVALFGLLLLDFVNLKFDVILTWAIFLVVCLLLYLGLSFHKTKRELGIMSYIYSLVAFLIGVGLSVLWWNSISASLKGFG
jgi:hypothetical protein